MEKAHIESCFLLTVYQVLARASSGIPREQFHSLGKSSVPSSFLLREEAREAAGMRRQLQAGTLSNRHCRKMTRRQAGLLS